jgi:DNA-binding GntR family transcriptional regulator
MKASRVPGLNTIREALKPLVGDGLIETPARRRLTRNR